jgi:hypothetical protein
MTRDVWWRGPLQQRRPKQRHRLYQPEQARASVRSKRDWKFQKLRFLLHRRGKEGDLRDELQFHLDEEAEEREAEGLSGEEASHAARRDMGNFTLVQEETRGAWTWTYLEQLAQDCRYGFRTIAASKTFSMLAIFVSGAWYRGQHGNL